MRNAELEDSTTTVRLRKDIAAKLRQLGVNRNKLVNEVLAEKLGLPVHIPESAKLK